MQLRTRVIGAAGIAAVVAAGGFAFTASNGLLPKEAGYSSVAVTGLSVDAWNFTYDTGTGGTPGNVKAAVFHVPAGSPNADGTVVGADATMKSGGITVDPDCGTTATIAGTAGWLVADRTLTCTFASTPLADIDNISLAYDVHQGT